jgi:NADH-quinone oxidoreductase subunit N
LASILLVVVFASFIGLPPLVGFTGKFLLFSASYQAYVASSNPAILITIITAAIASIVSLFYYFIIIRNMFMQEATWVKVNKDEQGILYFLVLPLIVAIIYFGILPSNFISYMQSIIA